MGEMIDPEQQRQSEIAELVAGIDLLDRDLDQVYVLVEPEGREFARDDIQEQIDELKAELFKRRTFKENSRALTEYIAEHAEEYQEFIEMGLPVDEYSIAYDVFQSEEIQNEYLEVVRNNIEGLVGNNS